MATKRKGGWTPIEGELQGFCEALYALIVKLACIFIYDLEMRQEVVQHTIVRIIRHRHKLHAWEQHLRFGYILKAVVFNHWRIQKQGCRFLLLDSQDGEDNDSMGWFLDDRYEPYKVQEALLEQRLENMLETLAEEVLTEDQCDIFKSRLRGRSYKEIARDIGREAGACRKSMSRDILPKLARTYRERGLI